MLSSKRPHMKLDQVNQRCTVYVKKTGISHAVIVSFLNIILMTKYC